jgi:hypothetical protein
MPKQERVNGIRERIHLEYDSLPLHTRYRME